MLKPCVSLDIMYPLRPSVWVDRGRRRQGRQRRGLAGSAGVLEQGKGMGRIARKPERSRSRPRAQQAGSRNTGWSTVPGLASVLRARQERLGEHETEEERVGPV